jgi:hypothetical protein
MFEKAVRQNLVTIASAYAEHTGLSLAQVSKKCYGNAVFLGDYKRGRGGITVKKVGALLDWFRSNWPEGAEWPPVRAAAMGRNKNG